MLLKFDFSGTNFLIVELSLNLAFSLSIQPCLGWQPWLLLDPIIWLAWLASPQCWHLGRKVFFELCQTFVSIIHIVYLNSFFHFSLQSSLHGHWFLLAGKEDMISRMQSGWWMNTRRQILSFQEYWWPPQRWDRHQDLFEFQIHIEISTYRCSDCRYQRVTGEVGLLLKGSAFPNKSMMK